MKYIKYFIQFLIIIISFIIFKLLGPILSSNLSGKIFEKIGPFFRPKKIILSNLRRAYPKKNPEELNKIINLMWNNYGRFFAEFMFIKNFRLGKLSEKIEIEGKEILEDIKINLDQKLEDLTKNIDFSELCITSSFFLICKRFFYSAAR